MAARVNYRLLSIIGLLVFIALVIVAGLLYLRLQGNVDRNLRRADEYQAAGDYKKAVGYYGRVVNKQPGHLEALSKLLEVYPKLRPDTPEQAIKMYIRYLEIMQQAALHAPADRAEQMARDLLEEQYIAAAVTGEEGFWRSLQRVSDNIITRATEENDLVSRAYYLRGMSMLRLDDESLTSNIDGLGNIRFPGEDDLEKHIELTPGSDIGWAKLAFARMAVARRLGLESRYAQEERNLKLARDTFAKAVELNPQGVWTRLEVLRDLYVEQLWYIGKNLRDRGSVTQEEMDSIRDRVKEALADAEAVILADAIDNEVAVLDLVRYLRLADGFDGEKRAVAILEAALEHQPDNDRFLFELARSQLAEGELEAARTAGRSLLDSESKTVSLRARTQWAYRILAAKLLFDIEFKTWGSSEDAMRQASYDGMAAAQEKLTELVGKEDENPLLLEADAKMAVAERNWSDAAMLFERVIDIREPEPATLRLAATALERNGQTGLALQRLDEALKANPNDLRNYIALAEMYGRARTPEKGVALLERLPKRIIEGNDALNRSYQSLQILASGVDEVPEAVSDPILLALAKADQALQNGDTVAARALLDAAMAQSEREDARLLVALAHVASLGGQEEEAVGFLDRAILLQPANERLKLLKIRYGNPVEAVKQYCTERYPDELERDAMIYENLRVLARIRENQAKALEEAGDTAAAAAEREVAAAAIESMAEYFEAADDAVDSIAAAFIGRFERLLADEKFEEARLLLPVAREKDFDQAKGNLSEARLELELARRAGEAGGSTAEALTRGIAAAQRATEFAAWSDVAWRTLAWGYEMQGDYANAERAYGESYRLDPTNAATLKKFVLLLLRGEGDASRAMNVLREAAKIHEADDEIQNLWLESEVRYGEPAIAYQVRKQAWDEDHKNRPNALRLAAMLAKSEPGPGLMLDDAGNRVVNARQWLGLSSARQAELLGELQAKWDVLMDAILEELELLPDENFSEAILHASVHVERQRVNEAVTVLRTYLDTRATDEELPVQTRAAAQFLIDADRTDEAIMLLKDALAVQSDQHEIDAALGSVLYARGIYLEAIPHLRLAVESGGSPVVRHRLIESLLRTQQFEEGRQQLQELRSSGGSPYELAMLEAFLANREGVLAGASGDATAEAEAMGRYRSHLRAAIAVDMDQTRPYELLVSDLLTEYTRTQDQSLLDEAVRVIDSASPVAKRSEPLMLIQADVQETRGNPRRAILDMESFLRTNPGATRVRERLVTAHVASGSPDRAKDTIEAAIVIDPESASWHESLGNFLLSEGDVDAATTAYISAFGLSPSRRLLVRLNEASRSPEKWDHEGVLNMVQRHQRMLEADPFLQSLHAKALARVGAEAQAKARIRKARDTYLALIQQELLPDPVLQRWFEDLQVVFVEEDPVAGEAFALGLIEGEPTFDDLSGLALYWSRWDSPETWDKAIARQEEVVRMAESREADRLVEALGALGSIQLGADREADASASFHRIVELTPDDTMALNNYAYLLTTLRGQAAEALPYAERAIKMEPENPSIIDTMATIQEAMGNYDAALVGRLNQLEYQPQDPQLLASIAMLYADHSSTPDKAVDFAERATKLQPRDATLMDVAGWAAFRTGRTAKGEDLVLQSIRRQPTARAHLHLAEIYLDQNRVEKAREQLRLAVEIADDDTTKAKAEEIRGRLGGG